MTLNQLLNRLDSNAMLEYVAKDAARRLGNRPVQVARKWSSGTWSTYELGRMGHPYRRGGPNPLDPTTINTQTGAFREDWQIVKGDVSNAWSGNRNVLTLRNDNFVADFMYGTVRMIQRPVWARIEGDLRGPLQSAILASVERWFRK